MLMLIHTTDTTEFNHTTDTTGTTGTLFLLHFLHPYYIHTPICQSNAGVVAVSVAAVTGPNGLRLILNAGVKINL